MGIYSCIRQARPNVRIIAAGFNNSLELALVGRSVQEANQLQSYDTVGGRYVYL